IGGAAGPEAEAVVVLGGEDHRAESGGMGGAGPLSRVEPSGREDGGVLATVAPLPVGEGVDAEVQEERQLVPLPGELGGGGPRPRGSARFRGSQGPRRFPPRDGRGERGSGGREESAAGDRGHRRSQLAG